MAPTKVMHKQIKHTQTYLLGKISCADSDEVYLG